MQKGFTHERANMKLSIREIQVLEFLCCGYGDKEIADRLKISSRTVQSHISRLILKLNARNRISAVATYLRDYVNNLI